MSKTVSIVRKIVVSLVGFPLLIIGIVLVPLPGPGLLVMLLALILLSAEFKWSKKYVEKVRAKLKDIMKSAQEKSDHISEHADKIN